MQIEIGKRYMVKNTEEARASINCVGIDTTKPVEVLSFEWESVRGDRYQRCQVRYWTVRGRNIKGYASTMDLTPYTQYRKVKRTGKRKKKLKQRKGTPRK